MAFTEEDTAEKKSFGYELIDLRMGGVITRLDSTRRRLHNYVEGKISRLKNWKQRGFRTLQKENLQSKITGREQPAGQILRTQSEKNKRLCL